MSGKEAMESVQLSDKALMFDTHKYFIGALIADEPLISLQLRLKQFGVEFETLFSDILPLWDGNVNIFLPAIALVDKIFMPITNPEPPQILPQNKPSDKH